MSTYVIEVYKTKPVNSKKDQYDPSFFLGYHCKTGVKFRVTKDITECIKYFKKDIAEKDVNELNDFTFVRVNKKFTGVKARLIELNC